LLHLIPIVNFERNVCISPEFYPKPYSGDFSMNNIEDVKNKWINYNRNIITRFLSDKKNKDSKKQEQMFELFSSIYLIEYQSDIEEDPDNMDGGIITIDTVTWSYIESFLGRWYIQETEGASEEGIKDFIRLFTLLFTYLRDNKLYKEGRTQVNKILKKLENEQRFVKRLKNYLKIQKEKDNEEKYQDLLNEWEMDK
jgi:hypothetical protein